MALDDTPQAEEARSWARFAPAALCHALRSPGSPDHGNGNSNGFEAAVLMADISGYSALASRLAEQGAGGAELLSQGLNRSFAVMLDEVHAHGGEVERFVGDALLASFRADGDRLAGAVQRAQRCAQAITTRLDGSRAGDVALGVHAGVAAGRLQAHHVQLAGPDRAFVLTGAALVEAAAASSAAAQGTVRLSAGATRLAAAAAPAQPAVQPASGARGPVPREQLAPYLNRALRERLDVGAGHTGWLAELRRVTAVFATPRIDDADAATLAQVAQVLGHAAERYGGHLQELVVDDKGLVGVLLFGLRRTYEDQASRALRAALALHEGLSAVGLQPAVGVASGHTYTGIVGDAQRSELAVVGEPMNRAARLMQAAGSGVLCDPATADEAAARQTFQFTAVPGLVLKGMPPGLLPQRPRLQDQPPAAGPAPLAAPLPAPLGRDAEWQQVLQLLQPVGAQASAPASAPTNPAGGTDTGPAPAAALLLEGDPGIGKSALLDAAAGLATRCCAALLRLQGQALEQVSPYHAWRGAVGQLLGVDLATDRQTQLTRLQLALADDPSAAEEAPLLSAVLPHTPPSTPVLDALDAQTRAERLREWLLQRVARAAAAVPLVLMVEDAHWLDSASWALLQGMAVRRLPVRLLVSSRPLKADARAALAAWQEAASAQVLEIGPLPRPAAAELMRRKLGVATLTDGVEALVHARAAGHPFFTEELVLALRDSGVLRIDGGVCALAVSSGAADPLLVPDTLARALTARIDGIGEAERLALKVASVLGRDFDRLQLAAVHPLPQARLQLPAQLQALVAHELLQTDGPGRYRFKHAITRDVAYGLLPFAQRRDLHRALAEHLHQQDADPQAADPQRAALLAHHWSHAEVADRALAASVQAAEQAMDRFAHREAVHFLRESMRWNQALGRPTPGERVAHWLSQLGLAHRLLGELDASRRALEDALRQLNAPVPARTPAARASTLWALLQFAAGRPQVAPAGTPPNADNTAVEAYAQLTMLAYYDNDVERLVACSVLAARAARRAAPGRELAALHGSLAHTASFFRLRSAMQRSVAAARLVAQRDPSPLVVGTAHQYTGHLAACRGDFAGYAADMTLAGNAYRPLGRCRQLDEADTNLACLYTHLGQLQTAFDLSRALEQSGQARDDLQSAGWGVVGQARVLFAQGRLDATFERLDACDGLLVDRLTRIEVTALRALALQRNHRSAEALGPALQAVQWLEEAPSTSYFSLAPYGHVMETLVRLASPSDDDPEGVVAGAPGGDPGVAAQARAAAPRMLKAFARYAALMPVAAVQHRIWTGALAQLQGRPAAALRAWRGARQLADRSQVPLDQPMAQRWLARAVSGAEQLGLLQQAVDGYQALGRLLEAEEARSALRRLQAPAPLPHPHLRTSA